MIYFTALNKFTTFCNRLYSHSWVQRRLLLQNAMLILGWMTRHKLARINYSLKFVRVNLPPAPFIICSHIFCPFYPPTPSPPILLLYPRENGEFGGTGREWRYHSDVSVRPSVRLPRNTESILLLLAWDAASSTTVMLLHASLVYRSCFSYIFTYACARHGIQTDWWKPSSKRQILLWNLFLVYLMSLTAEITLSDTMNR